MAGDVGPEGMAKPGATRGWRCEDVRSEWSYGREIFADGNDGISGVHRG